MKIFVGIGNRYLSLDIKHDISIIELYEEIVKAEYQNGIYAFSLYFQGSLLSISEGQITNEGITDGSIVIVRPNIISTVDLQIRGFDGKQYLFEVFPSITVKGIFDKFSELSGVEQDKNYLLLNGNVLKDMNETLNYILMKENDIIYCVPKPKELPENYTMTYTTLGNNLLMEIAMPDDLNIEFMKKEIEKRYKINAENLILYRKGEIVADDKKIVNLAPDEEFIIFTAQIKGTLSTTILVDDKEVQSEFDAKTTIAEVKKELFPRNNLNVNETFLQFNGVKCNDNEVLFSYCTTTPKFTIYGTVDDEATTFAHEIVQKRADKGEASFQYIYGKMLLNGISVPKDVEEGLRYLKLATDKEHYSAMTDYAECMYKEMLPEPQKGAAFNYAKKAAENGHIGAQYLAGLIAKKEGNTIEASKFFRLAAKAGHAYAQTAYARLIIKGNADTTEIKIARELLEKSSKQFHQSGMKTLAKILFKEGEDDKAKKLMKKAAEMGNPGAMFYLASKALAHNKITKAFELVRKSSQKGHAQSKRILGIMYKRGLCVSRDESIAFKYFEEAFKGGDIKSAYYLAKLYLSGKGCDKNEEEAFRLAKIASDQNHNCSTLLLCNLLIRGIGCRKDPEEAYRYALQAAENGYVKCIRFIGVCQRLGIGTEKNLQEAAKNLRRASESDLLAMYHYAMLLKESSQYPQNRPDVLHYLQEACKYNLPIAFQELGLLLLENHDYDDATILENKKFALKYFEKGASYGLIESQFQLGLLVLELEGDDVKGGKLIEGCAQKKHPLALYYLSLMLEEGRGMDKDVERARECLELSAELNVAFSQHRLGMKLY